MADATAWLRHWLQWLYTRLATSLSDAPPGLAFTGVLGLAAAVYGLYQYQTGDRRTPARTGLQARPAGPVQSSQTLHAKDGASTSSALQAARPAVTLQPPASQRMQAQLAGIRKITISAPGVLLEEWLPHELQEGASLRPEAVQVVADMASRAAVYILAHVSDDIGEATVRGALDAGGLVGTQWGQIPPHRLLFCATLGGKESIVRQLEPELHIDGHEHTIQGLHRFMPQLLLIQPPGQSSSVSGLKNVGFAVSLIAAFDAP